MEEVSEELQKLKADEQNLLSGELRNFFQDYLSYTPFSVNFSAAIKISFCVPETVCIETCFHICSISISIDELD